MPSREWFLKFRGWTPHQSVRSRMSGFDPYPFHFEGGNTVTHQTSWTHMSTFEIKEDPLRATAIWYPWSPKIFRNYNDHLNSGGTE